MIEYLIVIASTCIVISFLIATLGGTIVYLILSIIALVVLFALNVYLDRRNL